MKNIQIHIFLLICLGCFYIPLSGKAEEISSTTKSKSINIVISTPSPDVNITVNNKDIGLEQKVTTSDTKKESKSDSDSSIDPFEIGKDSFFNIWDRLKNKLLTYFYFNRFSLKDAIILFVGILITLIFARIVRWFIENYAIKFSIKTATKVDDIFFHAIGKPISLFIFSIGFFASSWPLTNLMATPIKIIFGRLCLALGAISVAWGIYRLTEVINYILTQLAEKTDNNLDDLIVGVIRKTIKVVIVVVSVLFIGQNILTINITTLLAGAGVMGLAIAFAAQDTIANFFGSLMLILDQPFRVGDIISVSGFKGSIEHVGFRSTRIRTLDGHMVSLPNKALANADIENIAKRPYIKHKIALGLTYDTGFDKMKQAVTILHKLLDQQECINPDHLPRIVFENFGDFSLNIGITIWWHQKNKKGEYINPDYATFVDWLHTTDMEILRIFDKEGLEFAFPTTTTYLAGDAKRKPEIEMTSITSNNT
jgi:MscS family membrane protein